MIPLLRSGRRTLPLAVAIAVAATLPAQSQAQRLEEVLVTAQKRVENMQDVPISIAAVSGEKLEDAGITRTSDLQAYIPNLTMTEAAIGSNVFIRGVGSQVNQGFEQSVATYVDGIYYGRPRQLRTPFFDLERVEVLRGPQSILFGKNSIGGALSLTTRKPGDEFEAEISAYYEPDHEETIFSGIISGPISDTLSGRLSLRKRDIEGYIENVYKGTDEMESDEWVARGILAWTPSDNLDITFKAEVGEYDTKGRNMVALGDPAPGGTTPVLNDFQKRAVNDPEFSDNEYDNYTLTLNYALGESTLTSVTGFSSYEFEELLDGDIGIATVFGIPSSEDYEQFSQELRLTSAGGETFDYIVGLFYQTSELDFTESLVLTLPSGLNVDIPRVYGSDSDLWAAFGQVTWNMSERLRLTAGVRYTEEDKDGFRNLYTRNLDGSVFPADAFAPLGAPLLPLGVFPHELDGDRSEDSTTPLVSLQWDVTDFSMLYASVSTGFKAGGFDARSNRSMTADGSSNLQFEEEEALSYEAGAKLDLMDGRARLNFAVFRTEYDDLQVSVYDGVIGFDVQNAAEATTQGLEMDGSLQVTDGLVLSATLGYTDFKYENYPNGACYKGQTPDFVEGGVDFCDWDGKTNQFTPEWSGTLGANYNRPIGDTLELLASLDLIYSDEYFAAADLDPNLLQDSYVKVNATLGLADAAGRWDVTLIGSNLTDEEVVSFGNDIPLIGPVQSYFAFVDRPATVAIRGRYRF